MVEIKKKIKKITKVLMKDKKIKEAVKNGQDAVAVFASRLFNTTYEECMSNEGENVVTRYNVALALANALATKNSGLLIEAGVAEMFKKLFETKVVVEVPVKTEKKTTTKKATATKKTTSKKTATK